MTGNIPVIRKLVDIEYIRKTIFQNIAFVLILYLLVSVPITIKRPESKNKIPKTFRPRPEPML